MHYFVTMETRRKLLLLERLVIMSILCSTAMPMHLVIFQKISEYRTPVKHQVECQLVPELLIVTSSDLRVPEAQNNAVKLWFTRFPPIIERIVQFIQNRFSTYTNEGSYPEITYDVPYSSTTAATTTTTTRTTSLLPTPALTTVESDQQTQVYEDINPESEEKGT